MIQSNLLRLLLKQSRLVLLKTTNAKKKQTNKQMKPVVRHISGNAIRTWKRKQDEVVVEMRAAFKERSLHGQEKRDEDNHRGSEVKIANLKREMSERRGMCVFSASVNAVACVALTDNTSWFWACAGQRAALMSPTGTKTWCSRKKK